MRILAIETSCDETGIAIVDGEKTASGFAFSVRASALLSQIALHREYGGVYPTLAKREHTKNLPLLLEQVLAEAGTEGLPENIDAVCVTHGPGLEPALWTGVTFAQELARTWYKPLYGINHMEGHLMAALAKETSSTESEIADIHFPLLALLVSGGHTEFIVSEAWFAYEKIGETLDDAAGEAFDKVARMLGLPYPGGPEVSRLAAEARTAGTRSSVKLPRPMLRHDSCDVSFSGLKTAALYALRDLGGAEKLSPEEKAAFAREFSDAVAEVFVVKTRRALLHSEAHSLAIGGGVAADKHLRQMLTDLIAKEFSGMEFYAPLPRAAGDNAIMIAQAALARLLSGAPLPQESTAAPLRADGNLSL